MNITKATNKPTCAFHTIPDPDQLLTTSHAEIGGTLEVRCEAPNYPFFDVVIVGSNPPDVTEQKPDTRYPGTMNSPVVLQLDKEGRFEYYVYLYHKDDSVKESPPKLYGPFACNVHTCPACKPDM
ncbi:MAG TPA: hypothetical protein VHZ09_06025 [Acidobacteriaceae bacterium]|jgi:hypothetical protein|nr:hypothetical protein [Acidobacteriaceae bacterium]